MVSSFDGRYPPASTDQKADGVGVTGAFLFTPADTNSTTAGIQSDVVSYKWRLNSGAVSAPLTVTKGTAAKVNVTPNQVGENTIQVWGFDAAGHSSLTGYYSFLVNPGAKPSGVWHFDGNGNDATTATPHALSAGPGASYNGPGRGGAASLKLDGTAGYAQSSGPVLDTTKSFSLSAWVRLSDVSRSQTIVSQQATTLSGFALHYSATSKRFVFSRYNSDIAAPTASRSSSLTAPVAGVWTHLTGVYDAVGQSVQLYVNGRAQGAPVAFTTPWAATGPLQVGRFHNSTGYVEYVNGLIDEVHVWSRVLADSEVVQDARFEDGDRSDGASGDPVSALVAKWDATDTLNATGTTIVDNTSGYVRPLTLSGATLTQITTGADPDTGETGTTRQTMQLNGSSAYASATGPIVDDTGSFTATAWVTLDPTKFTDTTKSYAVQVFGQSGVTQSSWGVWYEQPAGSSQGRWTFGRPDKDGTGAAWTKSESDAVSAAALNGEPVMLTAVYDAQTTVDTATGPQLGSLLLYVDSARVGSEDDVSFSVPWQGSGAFEVGRAKIDGAATRYMPGTVDSVRVWSGATPTHAIADRFNAEQ